MLDQYKHKRAKGDYPEQLVAQARSSLDVRSPVSGINESECYKKTGPEEAQERFERKPLFFQRL